MTHNTLLTICAVIALHLGAARADNGPLSGAVIVVDPGHGGQRYSKSYTGGTRGPVSRVTESELNLRVALELARLLKENGATVHLTRVGDHRLSREGSSRTDELQARVDFFEHYGPHFFLSVHHNAGRPGSGHTTLYKHNAKDDTLYEALARDVNDALEGAVPGPKLKLIKNVYYILGHTDIPGTISEAGFMTNKEFDELAMRPGYPTQEAAAIVKGAVQYWTDHKKELESLRDKLVKERAAKPRDPKTYAAIELNPEFQVRMRQLVHQVVPDGKPEPARIGDYLERFRKTVVTDPQATFAVQGKLENGRNHLTGEADKRYHDQLIDLLVALKQYDIVNDIKVPE